MKWRSIIMGIVSLLALVFGFSLIVLLNKEEKPAIITSKIVQPSPSSIKLQPPETSLRGILSQMSGEVKKIPWDKEASISAVLQETLYQGDEILVLGKSNASIQLPSVGNIDIGEQTSLLLGSLLPDRITLRQGEGSAKYNFEQNTHQPVSIRVVPGLLEMASGSVDIKNDPETVTIRLTSGEASLAMVDAENQTQVWKLSERDIAKIDKNTLTVLKY